MCYKAVRFKFSKEFRNVNEAYNFVRGILGELSKIDYVGYWDDINEEYKKTDEVESFSYGEERVDMKSNRATMVIGI